MRMMRIGVRSSPEGQSVPIDSHEGACLADDLLAIIHNSVAALPRELRDRAMVVISFEGDGQVTASKDACMKQFDDLRDDALKGVTAEPG